MNIQNETQHIFHTFTQGLLLPTIVIVTFLSLAAVWAIGSIISEALTERRELKEDIPLLLSSFHGKDKEELSSIVNKSKLLKRQKAILLELIKYSNLTSVEKRAIAKRLIVSEEERYERILGWTDTISKIAPMFGLMGTLIPLGPGIIALGQGDTMTLANALLVAFDMTIGGLVSAAVCLVISKIRRGWYDSYLVSMESLMECILKEE